MSTTPKKDRLLCALVLIALIVFGMWQAFYIGMNRQLCANWEQYTKAERMAMQLTADECGIRYHD